LFCCTPIGAGDQPSGGPSFKTQSDSRQLIGKSALANRYITPLLTAVSLPTHSWLPGNHAPSLYFLAVSRPLIVSPSAVAMPQSYCPIIISDETERNETHIPRDILRCRAQSSNALKGGYEQTRAAVARSANLPFPNPSVFFHVRSEQAPASRKTVSSGFKACNEVVAPLSHQMRLTHICNGDESC
jgi:hypothetical protein